MQVIKRRVARLLIAVLTFAHITTALAACAMDRGVIGQAIAMQEDSCDGAKLPDRLPNLCVAHCTADLQLAPILPSLMRAPSASPVLTLGRYDAGSLSPAWFDGPSPGAPPTRILLHSFQV